MAREDWRNERPRDYDEDAREMRRRSDYGQIDRGEYDRRYAESRSSDTGYPDYRRPYRNEMEERRRAARAERIDRDDDERRREEERALRPFGTSGPTAYGPGPDPYGWGPTYAPYAGPLYGGHGAPYGASSPWRGAPAPDGYARSPREGRDEEPRSFVDKARDEIASWFGDNDAERRRRGDEMRAGHRGRGPKGYRRSDDRICEDVNDRLTEDPWLDASDIEASVKDGDVTLTGLVYSREDKRRAERLAEEVSGVGDVQNNLRVRRDSAPTMDAKTAGNF